MNYKYNWLKNNKKKNKKERNNYLLLWATDSVLLWVHRIIHPPYRNTGLNPPPWQAGISRASPCLQEPELKVIWTWTEALSSMYCHTSLQVPPPITAQGPTSCLPSPTGAFSLPSPSAVGQRPSPSPAEGAGGPKSRGITQMFTHGEGETGPKSALVSSYLLVTAYVMPVSSPEIMGGDFHVSLQCCCCMQGGK